MAIKPNSQLCSIKEQIIEDPVSGLTFQFAYVPDDREAPVRLKIFGDLPYGNREFLFSPEGEMCGTGTALRDAGCATWLAEVKPEDTAS